jgi:carbonic anhydrase
MPRELIDRLRTFHEHHFPELEARFRRLVKEGQQPSTLFIGCSDSRLMPHLLMDAQPGEVFVVRNAGNFVPPYEEAYGFHGTSASIEFAVLVLKVSDIVVCGHSHCGAIRALYQEPPAEARHMTRWLDLAREAVLPARESEEVLRRTEQRSVVLQIDHLLSFPMVRSRVERGELRLHGWHYIIEDGQVLALDTATGDFLPVRPDAASAPTRLT